uniref:GR6 n=1 Tax=Hycleus phaleratus TaxID=1248972 RepID=A0A2U9NJI4_9CUCU|nr:GR6 [Hycleus phaleratus]
MIAQKLSEIDGLLGWQSDDFKPEIRLKLSFIVCVLIIVTITVTSGIITLTYSLSFYIPLTVILFNTFYLTDILKSLLERFKYINYLLPVYLQNNTERRRHNNLRNRQEQIINIEYIEKLVNIHCRLVNILKTINQYVNTGTIITLIAMFSIIINGIYSSIFDFINEDIESIPFMLADITVNLWDIFWLFSYIPTWSRLDKEISRTSTHIHELWNKYTLTDCIDSRIRQLILLSTKLNNNQPEFTVAGFFPLNESSIFMVSQFEQTW